MSRLTRAELDEIERFCENSPTWTLERVPRLIAHVRAQDEALRVIEEYATDAEGAVRIGHYARASGQAIAIKAIASAARLAEHANYLKRKKSAARMEE